MTIVRGIEEEFDLRTTADGLVRIRANGWPDAMYALGFAHGRDRGAQIELMRTLAQGRVCERLTDNAQTLALDRYFRRLGLAEDAAIHFPRLPQPYRGYVEAYATGLNRARVRHYPWLYRLVTGRPETFLAHDVLVLLKLAAYLGLAEGQRVVESFLQHALRRGVGVELLQSLFPALQGCAAGLIAQVKTLPPLYPGELFGIGGGSGGSNAWVVSGGLTASGFPLLANDPHLEVNRLPPVIYAAQIAIGDECITGATLPGLPGVLSGRNRDLAWGVTYSCADTSDFFVEQLSGDAVLVDGEAQQLDSTEQTIRRRNHADEPFIRMLTPSGVLESAPGTTGGGLSWRWVGQGEGGLASLVAFTDLLRCRTVAQARDCMRGADLPTLHLLLADRSGDIGYQLIGAIPRRKQGWTGLGPAAGFDGTQGWSGVLDPTTEHPAGHNPSSGFIEVANDDRTFSDHSGIATSWLAPYRGERIAELLRAGRGFTPSDFQHMQFDLLSHQARQFVELYLANMPDGEARRTLRDWDCRYDADSKAATLFERLHRSMIEEVFGARLGRAWFDHITATTGLYATLAGFFDRVLRQEDSPWLPAAARGDAVAAAVARAMDPRKPLQPWGEVNTIMLNNLFFGGRLPAWTGMDCGPFPLPGNHATIYQGNTFTVGTRKTSFAPCYRMVADLGNQDLWSNYPGGPGESRLSRRYRTVFDDWLRGGYRNVGGD